MNQAKLQELNRKKARVATKNAAKAMFPSPQEMAELNLIEISNLQYTEAPQNIDAGKKTKNQPETGEPTPRTLIRTRRITNRNNQHKSVELKRISVTERWTESFKAGRKTNSSMLRTTNVSGQKKMLPISVSNYLLLGEKKIEKNFGTEDFQGKNINTNQIFFSKFHRPKPSISSRTYYSRYGISFGSKEKQEGEVEEGQRRKIYPREQTYWKIYKA